MWGINSISDVYKMYLPLLSQTLTKCKEFCNWEIVNGGQQVRVVHWRMFSSTHGLVHYMPAMPPLLEQLTVSPDLVNDLHWVGHKISPDKNWPEGQSPNHLPDLRDLSRAEARLSCQFKLPSHPTSLTKPGPFTHCNPLLEDAFPPTMLLSQLLHLNMLFFFIPYQTLIVTFSQGLLVRDTFTWHLLDFILHVLSCSVYVVSVHLSILPTLSVPFTSREWEL